MSRFDHIIKHDFPEKKIVIIGDLVADQFLHGTISRVSREAPVFILRHDETETLPGGAANAAANIASLNGQAALIGLIGQDESGRQLLKKLESSNINCDFVVKPENFSTITKVRVLAGQHYAPRQQVIRIDYENRQPIAESAVEQLKRNLLEAGQNASAIIISDYNYGAANAEIGRLARQIGDEKGIPVLVDSRFRLVQFPNMTTATPNQEEVEQILGAEFTDADCAALCEKLSFQSLLVTCGNQGMRLIERGKPLLKLAAVGAKEPIDVTGAGDTVIAVYALGLASGLSFAESAKLANHAGGIVVMKKGTATVSTAELLDSLEMQVEQNAVGF